MPSHPGAHWIKEVVQPRGIDVQAPSTAFNRYDAWKLQRTLMLPPGCVLVWLVHVNGVQDVRVCNGLHDVEGPGRSIKAAFQIERYSCVHLSNAFNKVAIESIQVSSGAAHGGVPSPIIICPECAFPMFQFRSRFIHQIKGGDGGMLLQGAGEISPEPPCLIPIARLFPQTSVAAIPVLLAPAGSRQCDRCEDYGDPFRVEAIQNSDQLLEVRS